MTKRLLIDARQAEETRVVLLSGTRIEDFDYETENRKQLKGNVYLARVTRVEPSLQAAFVEYGGNRQGFLAFGEIHPDYYRIPVEDREALLEAERAETEEDEAENTADDAPETLGGEGADEDDIRPKRQVRRYKIQEVISRKQIMLVQVVKEERGNKGAALTTYLSLAGRYCVLMPNSNRGGGVSRKITNVADRKRLKTVVSGLDVQQGMAVIVRTAGAKRTKTEIARDYTYLSKLWDDIRERTLASQAPSVIHEEGNLIKRSIRDLYTSEIDEILVEGEEAYKTARAQMKMLIPSHAKKVVKYEDITPIFQRYQVEHQMDTIQSPQVTLKSGGYLVINQTEALVAVDVNSGRSTRERNIEETALKTNLEAAEELARQLRLRDLSGLIVVDFIDMEESRNRHAVERKMKDSMRNDRARIQIGSISHFGLLEMSRQRLRLSIGESISNLCPHCEGTGRIRSIDTAGLQMLRIIEEEAQKGKMDELQVTVHRDVALFLLNHKRQAIAELEERYGLRIVLLSDDQLIAPDYRAERIGWQGKSQQQRQNNNQRPKKAEPAAEASSDAEEDAPGDTPTGDGEDQPKRRKRGRRGGRRRRRRNGEAGENGANAAETENAANDDAPATDDTSATPAPQSDDNADKPAPKKRRSRGRGGKKSSGDATTEANAADAGTAEAPATEAPAKEAPATDDTAPAASTDASAEAPSDASAEASAEAPKRRTRKKADLDATPEAGEEKPAAKGRGRKKKAAAPADDATDASADASAKPAPKTRAKTAQSAAKTGKKAAKKAAKKAPAKAKKAAVSDTPDAPQADTNASPAAETAAADRAPVSSTPQDVVEVGDAKPASRRSGWWNRG